MYPEDIGDVVSEKYLYEMTNDDPGVIVYNAKKQDVLELLENTWNNFPEEVIYQIDNNVIVMGIE